MRSYACRSCSAAPWNRYSLSQSLRTSKFRWKYWRAYVTCSFVAALATNRRNSWTRWMLRLSYHSYVPRTRRIDYLLPLRWAMSLRMKHYKMKLWKVVLLRR